MHAQSALLTETPQLPFAAVTGASVHHEDNRVTAAAVGVQLVEGLVAYRQVEV